VLAQDLLLTAAHCVGPKSDYAVVVFENTGPRLIPVSRIEVHTRYDASAFERYQPTPDLALVRLAEALPSAFQPARLAQDIVRPRVGDRFLLAGYGMIDDADPKSAGRLFAVELPAIGNTVDATGIIMVRLSAGHDVLAGACDGDSGGPVYRGGSVAAVIGWRKLTGGRHCGTVTGATLVGPQLEWIADTAREMGSSLER
jgi:secreted trypsin-like serine protease